MKFLPILYRILDACLVASLLYLIWQLYWRL